MFRSKEEQFDFYWKEIFDGLAYNPIEFNTYRFDQTMSLPGKVNKLYDMFKVLAMNNQEVMDYLKEFVETFDERLYNTIEDVLEVMLEDGRLADVVRVAISEEVIEARTDYLDHTYLNLKERLDVERKEVIDSRGDSQTLGERLDSEKAEVTTQLSEMAKESLVFGATPLTELRMVFQYNNQFDISKIKRLKQMGFNTVIVPNSKAWQTDTAQMLAFLDLHLKYGVYTIIELNARKLMSDSYSEEQAWITSLENHPGLVGFYSFDEPVYNSISKANQELVYNRIKQVTVKNVYVSDVAFLTVRLPMFQEYYTEKAFDIYMVNNYLNHEEPGWIKAHILESMVNLKNTPGIIPPKVVIPSLPFYTIYDGYNYPPSELKIKAHIDAWRPFLNGSYAVFAHDNPLLTTTLDTSELYRKIVSSIPSYISNNITDNKMYSNGGIDVYEGGIDLYDEGIKVKNSPSYFEKGINIGGGTQLIQKYLFSVAELDFGTVDANSTKKLTISIPGASEIDGVLCNPFAKIVADGLIWNAHISALNVATIRVTNVTSNPIVLGPGTWAVDVFVR